LNPNSGIPYGHVPAYLPGSASLVEQLDQRVLVVLRDGKHVIGVSSKEKKRSFAFPRMKTMLYLLTPFHVHP